ncbi:MAG TPA: calcium-binding protein, partial [Ramlibacter sp.]
MDGATGADSMAGGTGGDTYHVDASADAVAEAVSAGTDTVIATTSFTLAANVEKLTLAGREALDGAGNSLANDLQGNGAANVLDGGAGVDRMDGGKGDDTYMVDNARDSVRESRGGGIDTVVSSVSRTLGAFEENLVLVGPGLTGQGN